MVTDLQPTGLAFGRMKTWYLSGYKPSHTALGKREEAAWLIPSLVLTQLPKFSTDCGAYATTYRFYQGGGFYDSVLNTPRA